MPTEKAKSERPTCFVIMPISDVVGYEPGHFTRVYQFLIKPACELAGYDSVRADDASQTNLIMRDVLVRTVESDIVLCDLSSRNPNVLYELGIRQAFDKPVTLIMDTLTPWVFDIQGLRTQTYDAALRVDNVQNDIRLIASSISKTAKPEAGDVNSMISLLSLHPAKMPRPVEMNEQTTLVLSELRNISSRLSDLEFRMTPRIFGSTAFTPIVDTNGKLLSPSTTPFGFTNVGATVVSGLDFSSPTFTTTAVTTPSTLARGKVPKEDS